LIYIGEAPGYCSRYGIGGVNRLGALLRLYVYRSASACGLLGCCRGRVLIAGAQLIRSGGRVHLRPIQSRLAAFGIVLLSTQVLVFATCESDIYFRVCKLDHLIHANLNVTYIACGRESKAL
jgi:hypothetical protein